MKELRKYIKDNKIKENLNKKELLELKELIINQCNAKEKEFIENRSKDCYLWEIEKRINVFTFKNISKI